MPHPSHPPHLDHPNNKMMMIIIIIIIIITTINRKESG
jgi:hypothetical protein